MDFSGGNPYGIYITGSKGILHGIHLRDLVVHDVTGAPKEKESGLILIAPSTEQSHFDDVLIDGVSAFRTSQWAGIMVAGVPRGYPPASSRNTNVIIRNSIAHDVAGDGIVLFQVNHGFIENSVTWHTGMQDTQSIGTPNAIWTWMCRDCTVRDNEAFLSDSPGVDGGAFDIDYGNDRNIVEDNYGHDTQGYCVAVFGAGWTTHNSTVRNNVCVANGLSPRDAHRQGAIFLATWNKGKIDGLDISGNRIFWNPPLASAAVVNVADITGSATFAKNQIQSESPILIRSNNSLRLDNNSYVYCGRQKTSWKYGGKVFNSFRDYQQTTGQDVHSSDQRGASDPITLIEPLSSKAPVSCSHKGTWCLLAFVSDATEDHASRGEIALLESMHTQFPQIALDLVVASSTLLDLKYDWNTGDIPVIADDGRTRRPLSAARFPSLALVNPAGTVVWHHDGFTAPAELGLCLRSLVGRPQYAGMPSEQ